MSQENIKLAQFFRSTAETVQRLQAERDASEERAKLAEATIEKFRMRSEAEKLASEMHQKGLNIEVDFQELVADIEKQASEGKLPVLQEAVKMAAPNMGNRIGNIHSDAPSGAGMSDFEAFLLGNVG